MKKIMFNDEYSLTQAVLEGRKTMTRRAITYPSKFGGQNVAGYYVCRRPSGELVEVCLHDEDERMIDGGQIFPKFNIGTNFVLTDVSKQELEKRRIPVYSYLL